MSDTNTTPPASYGPVFSPEAIASMRETWIANGLDPAAFDEAAGITAAPAATPAAPAATKPPSDDTAGVALASSLTVEQLTTMADDLAAAGVDPERIKAALTADGVEAEWAEDTRTDEEIEFDRLYPAADPAAYRPDYYGAVPTKPGDLEAYDTAAREWAASMDLAPEVGSHLISAALKAGQAYSLAGEGEQRLYKMEQNALFTRLAGSEEAAAARLAAARELLATAPKPFTDAMHMSGALHSAEIVTFLALEAERLKLRGGTA